MEEVDTAIVARTENNRPEELYCFIQDWQEEREFDIDGLKMKLSTDFVMDSFAGISDLKLKIMKILIPRLCACDILLVENDNFFKIGSINILRKPG
jgi:hypothetical protein